MSGVKALLATALMAVLVSPAFAAQRATRGAAHTSVNRGASATRNTNVNQNVNVNRNVNVNVNRDVDVHVHGGYGYNSCCYHPVATAVAVTAAVAITAAVVGSIVNSVPSGCVTQVVNGVAYQHCGSAWYHPQYAGTSVTYLVVNAPG